MYDAILRYPAVTTITGLSRTTIWRMEREGSFPPRRQLSANTVGWPRSEVEEWIAARLPVSATVNNPSKTAK
jgi:predicted DNA-binding transcriptional regulator AlpA